MTSLHDINQPLEEPVSQNVQTRLMRAENGAVHERVRPYGDVCEDEGVWGRDTHA